MKFGNITIGGMSLGSTKIGGAKLGNTLVYQAGSPTPPGPTPVFYDFLIFDGTAYIDTDIVPDANASFRVNLGDETLKAAQRLFGIPTGSGAYTTISYSNSTTTTNRAFTVYYGSSSSLSSNRTLAFSAGRYSLFLTPKRFGWGNNAFTITKGSGSPSGGLVIGSNSSHSGQPYTGKIRGFIVYGSDAQNATDASDLYNNYTPAYNLRPCTYNGEVGLWCLETSKFYGNSAGAGSLSVENE